MVNDAPHARSPKPIFAALLNLWFGLGQIYAGQRGDIVMVLVPNALHVRRVVGLPGDTVELRDFHAIVNGRPEQPRIGPCEHEDSPATWSEATRARGNWGPVVVPEGHYALFGDCRDNAYDTRQQAFPTRAQIGQRLSWIFFSRDTSGMRWDRIGQRVQ